jgi:hypothetical protein
LTVDADHAVFYHTQDADTLDETGKTYLAWRSDGHAICWTLNRYGVGTEWDGSGDTHILMTV